MARERTCAAAGLGTWDEHCPYHFSGSGKWREVKVSGVRHANMDRTVWRNGAIEMGSSEKL